MRDLTTVMWKEWREFRAQGDDLGRGTIPAITALLLVVVGVFAAVAGPGFVRTPILLFICAMPVLTMMGSICEAFAGERERHTLETLLASRLSSESLLGGKIAFSVLYAWAASLLLFVLCVISANVPSLGRTVTWPTVGVMLTVLVLLPLVLVFLSAAGALVSLRSATVRQAQTKLIALMMGLWFLLAVPFFVLRTLIPEVAAGVNRLADMPNFLIISIATWCAMFLIADVVLLVLAHTRFQRGRMIEIR